jgi:hypothetical protein
MSTVRGFFRGCAIALSLATAAASVSGCATATMFDYSNFPVIQRPGDINQEVYTPVLVPADKVGVACATYQCAQSKDSGRVYAWVPKNMVTPAQ